VSQRVAHRAPLGQRQRTEKKDGLLRWWPLIIGCSMAPFSVRAVQYLVLDGQWLGKALEPWAFLLQGLPIHLPASDFLAGALLWGQFPLYGFLLVSLHRIYHWITCLVSLLLIHILAVVMLFTFATS